MQPKFYAFGLLGVALMVLPSAAGYAQPAQSTGAQPGDAAAHEKITVYAPYVVTRKIMNPMMSKTSSTGIEVISVSRSVSFSDLNLSQPPDQITLNNRVHQAAQDACSEIEKRFPATEYRPAPNQDCVGNATREAMIIVKDLEDAASQDRGG